MTDYFSNMAADNLRFMRSRPLLSLANGTYDLFRIPKFAFIDEIWLWITTAYAGGATGVATVGFKGNGETADADGFMDSTYTDAESTGMKRMTGDAQPGSQGKWFNDASGIVTITLSAGTNTTLLIGHVFVKYYVLH